MKKSTKGAIAAGAAAVLLMGGAGTLAYWTADGQIAGGPVTSGHLKLEAADTGTWTLNGGPVSSIGTVRIVPGDELEFTGSYTIDAAGDNLQADVAVTGATESGTLAQFVDTELKYTVDGVDGNLVPSITEGNDGDILQAVVTVDFPFGTAADNASNVAGGLVLNLADVSVTLTQTDATP